MFSQVSVILFTGRRGVCGNHPQGRQPPPGQTPPPVQTPPWADTPPGQTPPEQTTLWADTTFPGRHPLGRHHLPSQTPPPQAETRQADIPWADTSPWQTPLPWPDHPPPPAQCMLRYPHPYPLPSACCNTHPQCMLGHPPPRGHYSRWWTRKWGHTRMLHRSYYRFFYAILYSTYSHWVRYTGETRFARSRRFFVVIDRIPQREESFLSPLELRT